MLLAKDTDRAEQGVLVQRVCRLVVPRGGHVARVVGGTYQRERMVGTEHLSHVGESLLVQLTRLPDRTLKSERYGEVGGRGHAEGVLLSPTRLIELLDTSAKPTGLGKVVFVAALDRQVHRRGHRIRV